MISYKRFIGIDTRGKLRQRHTKKNSIVLYHGYIFVNGIEKIVPADRVPEYRKRRDGIVGRVIKKNKDGTVTIEMPA